MRVLSGRLKAVLVASLATIILVGVLAPGRHARQRPPGLERFMYALGQVESGGRLHRPQRVVAARTASTRSCRRAGAPGPGRTSATPNASQTPANQEIVAAAQGHARCTTGSAPGAGVAYWWLTGSQPDRSGWSSFATRYVNRVMKPITRRRDDGPTTRGNGRRRRRASVAVRQCRRRAAAITLHRHVAARAAIRATPVTRSRYSTDGRRDRDVHVHRDDGSSGTARSARPAARPGSGSTASYVDDRRPARAARSRAAQGRLQQDLDERGRAHAWSIEVVGTAGHPYVAIDELVVG